jgi:hypothetical protein
MAKLSGGGLTSNKLVQSKAGKTEPVARAISPSAVAQLGSATAKKPPPLDMGRAYSPPVGPTGNLAQGPGGGRTVMPAGTQSKTPPARPLAQGKWGLD